jgi:hypothetical protein
MCCYALCGGYEVYFVRIRLFIAVVCWGYDGEGTSLKNIVMVILGALQVIRMCVDIDEWNGHITNLHLYFKDPRPIQWRLNKKHVKKCSRINNTYLKYNIHMDLPVSLFQNGNLSDSALPVDIFLCLLQKAMSAGLCFTVEIHSALSFLL